MVARFLASLNKTHKRDRPMFQVGEPGWRDIDESSTSLLGAPRSCLITAEARKRDKHAGHAATKMLDTTARVL